MNMSLISKSSLSASRISPRLVSKLTSETKKQRGGTMTSVMAGHVVSPDLVFRLGQVGWLAYGPIADQRPRQFFFFL